ncbi:MAG TPA: energy transducer TonB, partial [Stellaceae bacterium]|nr:energy transducer TonB [Stellaceae bacterium]
MITGGLAESESHDGIVIRLFSPVPDDKPADLPAPSETFFRSSLGRAVIVSAGLHVVLLALILLAWMPQSTESVPISVTMIWEPVPAPPVEPAPAETPQVAETAGPAPAIEDPAAAGDPAPPALPPPQLAAIEPAAPAPAAPEAALPPPPPRRPPTPVRAAPTPSAAPAVAKPTEAQASAPAAAASPPPQTAALPLIPPRPVAGAAGNAVPDYPAAARRQRLQGKVVLQVEVSPQGTPGK